MVESGASRICDPAHYGEGYPRRDKKRTKTRISHSSVKLRLYHPWPDAANAAVRRSPRRPRSTSREYLQKPKSQSEHTQNLIKRTRQNTFRTNRDHTASRDKCKTYCDTHGSKKVRNRWNSFASRKQRQSHVSTNSTVRKNVLKVHKWSAERHHG